MNGDNPALSALPDHGEGGRRLGLSLAFSLVLHLVVLFVRWHGGAGTVQPWGLPLATATLPALTVSFRESVVAGEPSALVIRDAGGEAVPAIEVLPVPANMPPLAPAGMDPLPKNQPPSGLGIIAEHYRRPSELTEPPYPLTVASLDFPDEELGAASGRYVVEIYINESGRVDDAEIIAGSPPPALRKKAKHVFGDTRYKPGIWRGKSVKSRLRVELFLPPKP